MTKKFLDAVYGDQARTDIMGFYADWADTYETEIADNQYQTPERAARLLAEAGIAKDARILDYGCGTGLSGAALHQAGFSNLTGTDPSAEMLELAKPKGIYSRVWQTDLEAPLPIAPGVYDVIAAIGVVSPGAAPAELLTTLVDLLDPGAHLLWTFNEHGLEDPAYTAARDAVLARPSVYRVAEEHGPHLVARNLSSTVYLIRAGATAD